MADYYTNFSLMLKLNPEQKEYALQLAQHIETHRQQDQPLPDTFPTDLADAVESWTCEVEKNNDGIWLHSQYGGQESACAFIQHLLQRFDFAPFVAFEWSHDCSKPLTDAFGGGAAFITSSEIEIMTTSEWLQKMAC